MKSTEFTDTKGTYAAVQFDQDTKNNLQEFVVNNNIPDPLNTDDIHSTLLYSRNYLPNYEPLENLDYKATPDKFEVWESPPNAFKDDITYCLVLLLNCTELEERFDTLMDEHPATYDYDEYKPHISLAYNVGEDFDIKDLNINEINDLHIVNEYSEDLDLNKSFD